MDRKVVLITGVCGETGSYLAEECLRNNEVVIGIDNLFKGTLDNIKDCLDSENFVLLIGDLRNIGLYPEMFLCSKIYGNKDMLTYKEFSTHGYGVYFPYIEEVYNLGAVVETRFFYERPDLTFKINCQGAIEMFDWAISKRVKKFVNASSSEIYGHGKSVGTKWTESENSIYDAVSESNRWSYAHGKILTEYYMNHQKDKIEVCHLRYANCYGPRDLNREHIIPLLVDTLLTGRECSISRTPDKFFRSYLYMSDAAKATYLAMKNMRSGEAYNVGTDDVISVSDLLSTIEKLVRNKGYVGFRSGISFNINRPGDPKYRCLDCSKAYNELGWYPSVSLEDGVSEVIDAMVIKLREEGVDIESLKLNI